MNSEYESANPKIQAFKEQHDSLEKRIRLFGRTALAQAVLLLLIGAGTLMAQEKSSAGGPIFFILIGRPWVSAGLGSALLLCYLGIRWKNWLCGIAAMLLSGVAMIASPLLPVSYAWSSSALSMKSYSLIPLAIFIVCYLLPFSILIFHISAFFRWRSMRLWCGEQMDHRLIGIFEQPEWKFRPSIAFWLFLFLTGGYICFYDVTLYLKAVDLSGWQAYTIPQTQVSMYLPVEGREEFIEENSLGVRVMGDRLSVSFAVYEEGGIQLAGEDKAPDPAYGQSLISNETGTMGDVEYHQTITRRNLAGVVTDVCIRSFYVDGKQYLVMVVTYEKMEDGMRKIVDQVLDTIETGATP